MSGSSSNQNLKHILIVDDEVDIISTFSTLLEMYGFNVSGASNGKEALRMVQEVQPDLVISDCMMPIMDGLELAQQIKKNPATSHIPIILMSGAPHLHQLNEVLHDAFLLKPVRLVDLLSKINELLQDEG